MKKKKEEVEADRALDASLRVSSHVHKGLKAAAAMMGRPIYDVAGEAIGAYLAKLDLTESLETIRRGRRSR